MSALNYFSGGRKKNIPFRRQRMEIECLIPPSEPDLPPAADVPDPYVADLLETADKRISEMEGLLKEMTEKHDVSEMKVENFRQQVGSFSFFLKWKGAKYCT